jgi:hypothetical protein
MPSKPKTTRREHSAETITVILTSDILGYSIRAINIMTYSTTRKNVTGFLPNFVKIKDHNRLYLWDSYITRVIKNVLCFI